ncbi:replication restart DNA helicase PriA [Sinosporangium album]|uniref:Probable replication restart protein PriA n=1 Tax=Sinosporangium album TaxID=504805 RepID=A0A1G7XEW3_9ACTN|nr:primosomal protein N' [Sinosporangium album]SDG82805.1 replication restart DNA helicase PriA [Sinosporangium album]
MTDFAQPSDDDALLPLSAVTAVPAAGEAEGDAAAGGSGAGRSTPRTGGGRAAGRAAPGGKPAAAAPAVRPAESSPVARVAVDNPLPHLDRLFDYLVPHDMADTAVPGCRVRVRFAGKLVDGFLLERAEESEHQGKLTPLTRVVSPEAVVTPEIAGLARAVADHYAGTMADVLRLAVPPRHARVESEARPAAEPSAAEPSIAGEGAAAEISAAEPSAVGEGDAAEISAAEPSAVGEGDAEPSEPGWADYPMGGSFLSALAEGRSPRAVWTALPGAGPEGPGWPGEVAHAVWATLRSGRGAVVVVPDGKDVAVADAALTALLGTGAHVALTADLGPAERYRRWLRVLRGEVAAAVGTRAAAFAPVRDLGLAVIWDDGDDLHAEPHAPYPHARDVLALRAHRARAGLLIGGYTRTAEATQLIAAGWARPIAAARETVRTRAPRVRPAGEDADLARDQAARAARLPSVAWQALKHGLESGPVLVQVPRRGYLPALACQGCRAPARCAHCRGPLALRAGHSAPACRWCGRIAADWRCPSCGTPRIRAVVVGARRTAEELGRAFPSVTVRTSGRDGVLASVGPGRALVVATPGAEPVVADGYAAAVLLDGWALLGRADLRAAEEALRRWMNAAALLRPRAELVVLAGAALPAVQALLRWDPVTHAERELADRAELAFPPAVRMATLTGSPSAVREMLAEARLPETAEVLGPVPVETPRGGETETVRAMVRAPRAGGADLVAALKGAAGVRSARKAPEVVRICVDPLELI